MAASERSPYAWARHLHVTTRADSRLPEAVDDGLRYASDLAENAYDRSQDPRRLLRPEQLTLDQLAAEEQLPVEEIEALIARARRYFFGRLSDAAIAKRAQRQQARQPRRCKHPGCERDIPTASHGNRRYCPTHAKARARTRRHRARQPKKTTPAPP
jgi:hypothetical protein